jgi:DNA polymerase-1
MSKNLIILDGNHLAYRAYYKFPNLKTFDGVNTSVIYGIPYIVESLIRRFTPDKAIIAIDGGRSEFRKELLPSYKEREQKLGFDKEDFYRQRDSALDFMTALGVTVVGKKGYEADDLITMLCRRYTDAGWKVIIISGDKDFNQLIDDNITVFNTGKGIMFDKDNLYKMVGYKPSQCVDYLCLTGDHSDNIPGYPGIGEKRGLKFLEENTSIRMFLSSTAQFGKMDKVKLKEIYTRNRKLVDLKYFYRQFLFKSMIPTHGIIGFSEEMLKKLCNEFETNSFLKPQFINTYKHLWERSKE